MVSWKMKLTGYILIACGVAFFFIAIFAPIEERELAKSAAVFLIPAGIGLLTINSGKTIVGELAKAKEEAMLK